MTNTRDVVPTRGRMFYGASTYGDIADWYDERQYNALRAERDAAIRERDEAWRKGNEAIILAAKRTEEAILAHADASALRAAMEKLRDACIESQDFIYAGIATGALARATPQPAVAPTKEP